MERAGRDAVSPAFANMFQQRAFAAAMGDDMETSNAGFADPFADGVGEEGSPNEEVLASGY